MSLPMDDFKVTAMTTDAPKHCTVCGNDEMNAVTCVDARCPYGKPDAPTPSEHHWQLGLAGRCNIVKFNGEDVVGIATSMTEPEAICRKHNATVNALQRELAERTAELAEANRQKEAYYECGVLQTKRADDAEAENAKLRLAFTLTLGFLLHSEFFEGVMRERVRQFISEQPLPDGVKVQDALEAALTDTKNGG